MMKVAVRFNSLLRGEAVPSEATAARVAATASLSGIDTLLATLPDSSPTTWLKALTVVKSVFDGPLVISCAASTDTLDTISKLRPDMVVVTAENALPLDSDDIASAQVQSFCQSLRTSRISYGVFVDTTVADIKRSRQLEAEVVVLPVSGVLHAEDTVDVVSSLEQLEAAAIAADKLGLRVLLDGELERTNWAAFSDLGLVEGVVLGTSVVDRAIQFGLAPAIEELKAQS